MLEQRDPMALIEEAGDLVRKELKPLYSQFLPALNRLSEYSSRLNTTVPRLAKHFSLDLDLIGALIASPQKEGEAVKGKEESSERREEIPKDTRVIENIPSEELEIEILDPTMETETEEGFRDLTEHFKTRQQETGTGFLVPILDKRFYATDDRSHGRDLLLKMEPADAVGRTEAYTWPTIVRVKNFSKIKKYTKARDAVRMAALAAQGKENAFDTYNDKDWPPEVRRQIFSRLMQVLDQVRDRFKPNP